MALNSEAVGVALVGLTILVSAAFASWIIRRSSKRLTFAETGPIIADLLFAIELFVLLSLMPLVDGLVPIIVSIATGLAIVVVWGHLDRLRSLLRKAK